MLGKVSDRFMQDFPSEYNCIYMNNCAEKKKKALIEKRLINNALLERKNSGVLISRDEAAAIMINAEDHIRIQTFSNGMNLSTAYKRANEIDDYIDSKFDYAFDEKYGYKTTFLSSVGTGLRASYIMHLPALSGAKRTTKIGAELGRFGISLKSLYGEDNSYGNLYQISTQKTLGQTEEEIINDLNDIVVQIINQEREQRIRTYEKDKIKVEDTIYKSYGVLKYARKLPLKDAMMMLSELMLGQALGIITLEESRKFSMNKVIMDIQPAVLNNVSNKGMSVEEIDILRAEYIRNNCPDIIGG
jgi:protein arginine kinase